MADLWTIANDIDVEASISAYDEPPKYPTKEEMKDLAKKCQISYTEYRESYHARLNIKHSHTTPATAPVELAAVEPAAMKEKSISKSRPSRSGKRRPSSSSTRSRSPSSSSPRSREKSRTRSWGSKSRSSSSRLSEEFFEPPISSTPIQESLVHPGREQPDGEEQSLMSLIDDSNRSLDLSRRKERDASVKYLEKIGTLSIELAKAVTDRDLIKGEFEQLKTKYDSYKASSHSERKKLRDDLEKIKQEASHKCPHSPLP